MNDLTIPSKTQLGGYSGNASLTVHLAKMLALVAPITMSSEQQEVWLRAAADTLADIRSDEIEYVSLEVRRSVTRPSQIVPEISCLIAERRAHQRRISEWSQPKLEGPPPKRHIADRDRSKFTADDWAELNIWLESQGAKARYRIDGTKYLVSSGAN